MIPFSKIWYWMVVVAVLILAAGVTTLFPQTNDVSVSDGTIPLDTPNKVDPSTKAESQQEVPTSLDDMGRVDLTAEVKLGRLLNDFKNDLRQEYLDARAGSINWWLQFIAIVLAFFGLVIIVLGYFGIRSFKELEADAKKHVEEIKKHHTQSKSHLEEITSVDISDPEKTPVIEKAIDNVQLDPDPSFIDKVLTEIYTLQHNGRVEDAVEKWRSIANIAEGTNNDLAFRAWLSIAYLLPEGDDRLAAYNKAMNLNPDYIRSRRNQPISRHSKLFHDTIIVEAVLHYFKDPKFEKFSAEQEDITVRDYGADVMLHDEEGRLVIIVECKVDEYVARPTMAQFKRYFRNSGAQFGLLAASTDFSNWTFFRILGDEITEITRSQFEEGLVELGSS